MAKEIEKKFLVNINKLPKLENGEYYVQAYLSLNPHIRIRVVGDLVTVTIKKLHTDKSIREEWEFTNKMSPSEIKGLLKLAVNKPVEKIRYKVKHLDLLWEIDVYQGENKGLITTDVELKDFKGEIKYPNWVLTNKEITNDSKYFNVNLGNIPYSTWNNL